MAAVKSSRSVTNRTLSEHSNSTTPSSECYLPLEAILFDIPRLSLHVAEGPTCDAVSPKKYKAWSLENCCFVSLCLHYSRLRMRSRFLLLPTELKLNIIECLPARDILCIRRVCTQFRNVVNAHETSLATQVRDRELRRLEKDVLHHDYAKLDFITSLERWTKHRGIWLNPSRHTDSTADFVHHWAGERVPNLVRYSWTPAVSPKCRDVCMSSRTDLCPSRSAFQSSSDELAAGRSKRCLRYPHCKVPPII